MMRQPKTTEDIMSKFNKALAELEQSEQLFSKQRETNDHQITKLQQENTAIESELTRNRTVKGKLKDLLSAD